MIKFNLTSELRISNGTKIEEIGNALQNFTKSYLYLDEELNLYSVNEFSEMPYENCILDVVENGFLLSEKSTGKLVHVFDKDLMNYLVNEKVEFTSFQGYSQEEKDIYQEEIITTESIYQEEIITTESMYETVEDESDRDESEKDETLEDETLEDETVEYEIVEDETVEDETVKGLDYEAVFRIQLKDFDDYDNNEPVYIGKKMFNELEIINDIDLKETLNISFSSFLKIKGYNVKTDLYFYENKYAEVVIYTNKPIDTNIIEQIEEDAILEVNSNDLIYFNYIKRENVYSSKVPVDRLPSDLIKLCMKNLKYITEANYVHTFYYKNSEIKIKNEGYGFYSIFDLDLHFYLSRLHPDYYPNVFEYNELPVAQFYYKK